MPSRVKDTYIVTFELPDDYKHSKYIQASRDLREKGCTEVRYSRHYDITTDGLLMTVIGYVLETV